LRFCVFLVHEFLLGRKQRRIFVFKFHFCVSNYLHVYFYNSFFFSKSHLCVCTRLFFYSFFVSNSHLCVCTRLFFYSFVASTSHLCVYVFLLRFCFQSSFLIHHPHDRDLVVSKICV
jgi:hypothetical protein